MPGTESSLRLGPISPAAGGPLYQQIVDGIKREIAAGRIHPGQSLPSFRALAEELLVSLITVKRAYEDLEREGILQCHQGLGTFVTEAGVKRSRDSRREAAWDALKAAVTSARQAGVTDEELIQRLRLEIELNPQ